MIISLSLDSSALDEIGSLLEIYDDISEEYDDDKAKDEDTDDDDEEDDLRLEEDDDLLLEEDDDEIFDDKDDDTIEDEEDETVEVDDDETDDAAFALIQKLINNKKYNTKNKPFNLFIFCTLSNTSEINDTYVKRVT